MQKECRCAVATSDSKSHLAAKFVGSRCRAAAFFLQGLELCTDLNRTQCMLQCALQCVLQCAFQGPKLCTDLNRTLLYSENIYQIRMGKSKASARRLLPAAILERWPHVWPHVCRAQITFKLLLTNEFISTKTNSMKCLVKWILRNIRVRSRNSQPHLDTKAM